MANVQFTLALVISLLVPTSNVLTIEVHPHAVKMGDSISVVCHVPRQQHRRWLEIGIENVPQQSHQIHGGSPTLWLEEFYQIPCDAGRAYCAVGTEKEPKERVVVYFEVTGCPNAQPS